MTPFMVKQYIAIAQLILIDTFRSIMPHDDAFFRFIYTMSLYTFFVCIVHGGEKIEGLEFLEMLFPMQTNILS